MTYDEISTMIESIGVPSAYYQFEEDTAEPTPFICFYFADSDDFMADNINYQVIRPLTIELYTDNKDFDLEQVVEDTLIQNKLSFTRSESYIDDEHMFMVAYYTEVIING